MIMKVVQLSFDKDILQPGVYAIRNINSGKMYIGSTSVSIKKRLWHHVSELKRNRHKNYRLSEDWVKYGEKAFEFVVLENTCTDLRKREQHWMEFYNSVENGYNINPLINGKDSFSKETIEKRSKSIKKSYESGRHGNLHKNLIPWNKGLKWSEEHKQKLKESAKGRKMTKKGRESFVKKRRNLAMPVYVYDQSYNLLIHKGSIPELCEWSIDNKLPVCGRFSKPRGGTPIQVLKYHNVKLAIQTGKSYKGLLFYSQPVHQVTDEMNRMNSGEVHQ